jgi:hypothetical protein
MCECALAADLVDARFDSSPSSHSLLLLPPLLLAGAPDGDTVDASRCKVIKDIASLFTGNIDKLIKSAIEKAIPGEVDSLVGTYGNSILSQLVEVVKVGKDASVDFRLTNNPYTTATSLYFDLLGEFIKPTAE